MLTTTECCFKAIKDHGANSKLEAQNLVKKTKQTFDKIDSTNS